MKIKLISLLLLIFSISIQGCYRNNNNLGDSVSEGTENSSFYLKEIEEKFKLSKELYEKIKDTSVYDCRYKLQITNKENNWELILPKDSIIIRDNRPKSFYFIDKVNKVLFCNLFNKYLYRISMIDGSILKKFDINTIGFDMCLEDSIKYLYYRNNLILYCNMNVLLLSDDLSVCYDFFGEFYNKEMDEILDSNNFWQKDKYEKSLLQNHLNNTEFFLDEDSIFVNFHLTNRYDDPVKFDTSIVIKRKIINVH